MFQRLVTGNSTAFCEIVAFSVAAAIFVTISWCALRMKRPQVEHFANLPFATETRPAGEDQPQP
jgi:hypothetical protein